jgi:purine nucleosidase
VTICALGPLTNIAIALERNERIAGRLEQIVWMGGALSEGGNVTPAAEFNCYVDPEAVARVLSSEAPLVMMPLDVTHKAHVTAERIQRFHSLGNKVIWLLQPELLSGRKVNVEVEPISPLTTGMTMIDWWGVSGRTKNAYVVRDIDVAGFHDTIFESFRRLSALVATSSRRKEMLHQSSLVALRL